MPAADEPVMAKSWRTGRVFVAGAVILPLVCCGAVIFFQVFWGTPVGPLGPVLAYPFFTHPPASAEKPPSLPDAWNVSNVTADALKTRTMEYETTASPSTVYDFYRAPTRQRRLGRQGVLPEAPVDKRGHDIRVGPARTQWLRNVRLYSSGLGRRNHVNDDACQTHGDRNQPVPLAASSASRRGRKCAQPARCCSARTA